MQEIISTESWVLCIASLKGKFSHCASAVLKSSKRNVHSRRIPHQPLQHEFVFGLLLEGWVSGGIDWILTLFWSAMTANSITDSRNTLHHCKPWHRKKLFKGVAEGRKTQPDLLQHTGIHPCPALRIVWTGMDPLLALCRPQMIFPISITVPLPYTHLTFIYFTFLL